MLKNTGKEYEIFVGSIQQSLINAEKISNLINITVEVNKIIIDRNGISRQFDVYWEFSLGGYAYKSVIECKDYNSTISIDKIDAFIGKTADIPDLKRIYATKTGYQKGAKLKAEQHKIDLLIVREADDNDWQTEDGIPLIKTVNLNVVAVSPPTITSFSPTVDGTWLASQPDIDLEQISRKLSSVPNNTLFISNETTNEKYSIYDLQHSLPEKIPNIQYGKGTYNETLSDSYLELADNNLKIKLHGYTLEYIYNEPVTITSIIDYSKDLLGIVHNSISGDKQMVFKDKVVKP